MQREEIKEILVRIERLRCLNLNEQLTGAAEDLYSEWAMRFSYIESIPSYE